MELGYCSAFLGRASRVHSPLHSDLCYISQDNSLLNPSEINVCLCIYLWHPKYKLKGNGAGVFPYISHCLQNEAKSQGDEFEAVPRRGHCRMGFDVVRMEYESRREKENA